MIGDQPIAAGDKLMVFYGVGQPRRGGVRRPRPLRRRPRSQPAHGLRRRRAAPVPGLHVARIEIAEMLRELLTRLPEIAPAGPPEALASNFITGVRTMPVTF